ncbi:hypothetical protein ACQP2X_36780 [Actinoplanes sp. CA-131856]
MEDLGRAAAARQELVERPSQPELPGANDIVPEGTAKTPSLTTASAVTSPILTRTTVPTAAGAETYDVFRLP